MRCYYFQLQQYFPSWSDVVGLFTTYRVLLFAVVEVESFEGELLFSSAEAIFFPFEGDVVDALLWLL